MMCKQAGFVLRYNHNTILYIPLICHAHMDTYYKLAYATTTAMLLNTVISYKPKSLATTSVTMSTTHDGRVNYYCFTYSRPFVRQMAKTTICQIKEAIHQG